MNDFIGTIENNTQTFNRDITATDLEKNTKVVIKCYATIEKNKNISVYVDIVESDIYSKAKEAFDSKINEWIDELKFVANNMAVPFINLR